MFSRPRFHFSSGETAFVNRLHYIVIQLSEVICSKFDHRGLGTRYAFAESRHKREVLKQIAIALPEPVKHVTLVQRTEKRGLG